MGTFDDAAGGIGSVTINGWALDPDENSKSLDLYVSVGGPVFTANAEGFYVKADAYREDVNNTFGCGGNHGFHTTIGTKLTGWQDVYVYAYDNNGNADASFLGQKTVYITPDTEAPVLGDVVVFSSDNNKYTVACAVTDNGFISKVVFPTWTADNPDNKIWYEGFVYGGVAYCDIPISDFNNYNGRYHTHCYAYDSAGNQASNGNFSTTFNNPVGCVDNITESDGVIRIAGWAYDADALDEAAAVHIYVGEPGSAYYEGHNITADLERLDVDNANHCGPNHGFDAQITTTMSGTQPVYVYAINKGNGGNVLIDKREITISSEGVPPSIANPQVVSSDLNGFTVSCEVTDNRRVKEVNMAVWPENNYDAIRWYNASIDNNTATATIPVADFGNYNGKYEVHIYADDYNGNSIGYPFSTTFNTPVGSLDSITESDGTLHIRGWALDRDVIDEPVEIHVYVGAPSWIHQGFSGIMADTTREDVAIALNCDPNHGFDFDVKTFMPGTQDVYVYAINKGNGDNVLIGKQTVNISQDTTDPVINGASISASDAESFTVSCDVSDDRGIAEVNMCVWPENNQDAGIWYKAKIENGEITARIPIADFGNHNGKYTIHIYAKDWQGNESGFAYETTFNMPMGTFDSVEDRQGAICVKGWAIDGDAIDESLYVDVYIGAPAGEEGAEYHRIKADDVKSDVDAFLNLDSIHGYDEVIKTEKRGEQTVYVYAINVGNGDNIYLGSKVVTISEPPAPEILYGDADHNGQITIADVTRVQQIVAGIVEFTDDDLIADVDGTGKLDIRDATMIQRYLAKYIDKFPVED